MPRKGVVPPQLRAYLFRKKGKSAKRAAPAAKVTRMARRGRGRGRSRRTGQAALPLIPTLVALIPEITVGAKAAIELKGGAAAGDVANRSLGRLGQLYGGRVEDPASYGVKENVMAKATAAITHVIMRKAGLRMRVSKKLTLF